MYIEENTLDDLLNTVLSNLIKLPFNVVPSKGRNSEIIGALLVLKNPLARLSVSESRGKAFSPLGELLWYLSKSDKLEFIEYYIPKYKDFSDDGHHIYGAYGPRLFNMNGEINQLQNVIKNLRDKPFSRKAVIQLFDAKDILEKHKDVPCTCFLQFLVRDGKLQLYTSMRSNDAYLGLPHDIFCFTMLQEIVATELGLEIGLYKHAVCSLHLYEIDKKRAAEYLEEGVQGSNFVMDSMPKMDTWKCVEGLLEIEKNIRNSVEVNIDTYNLPPYWRDLGYLLRIHANFVAGNFDGINDNLNHISSEVSKHFVNERLKRTSRKG